MSFLLDTNICIYLIKRKSEKLLAQLSKHQNDGLLLSSVTLAELDYGVEKSNRVEQNRRALDEFTTAFTIAAFDERASLHYGALRARLERTGQIIGPLDLLIAAHAISLESILITNNLKEFIRVPGLKTKNWI